MPVRLIDSIRHGDARGWFMEVYSADTFAARGIDHPFVQDNHSYTAAPLTLRGLHFQMPPHAQAKLVRCTRGRILDVAIDIRAGSPTYGEHVAVELSAENGRQLYIPIGFAHGFLTLEANCEVMYKVSSGYAPACDAGIRWDSADVAWPLPAGIAPGLSAKDVTLPPLVDFSSPFTYDGNALLPLGVA